MDQEIPLYDVNKIIGREVLESIGEVLDSGWLTLGPKTEEFEATFSDHQDSEFGVAVNSCTSALYAALDAVGIGAGDTVVVPGITFVATANVVELLDAQVTLCDVQEDGNMDPSDLEKILETRDDVAAVIPVHLYGQPCDMEEIMDITQEHDIAVIEDCAHAPMAEFKGQRVGSFGDAGCFSFYATKNMTTGEGGMVTTNDPEVDEHVRKIRNHHQTMTPKEKKDTWGYDADGTGFNFRMSEIQAAMGIAQLDRLPEMTESRREVAARYQEEIEKIPGLRWESEDSRKSHAFHLFVVQVEDEYPVSRNDLFDTFDENEVITGVHYPPISRLSQYEDLTRPVPKADTFADRILSLPMYPDMSGDEQKTVLSVLRNPTGR
ncbi:DegT/DnrJ/EryC1/StrS family aminotransferase [Haloterrigena sp. SYSU A558-1]|uniref:DegT/DnrJ/EryC1/StrS family aminotransferase n=1 Tax=Haloterrigena gelatinilytica TaxID=2741724 RepID=A0ABX2L7I3_9EURY|nr:DegT/DnrJ/EryC1/StrS family aminotransferase [Haloterrigena gelatinilytica]NUC70868.1 DegT/DnrJ/EryC1/StrS family aminotransferase [Haloterrigena gelatinilytica]